jgi:hypothetical protein
MCKYIKRLTATLHMDHVIMVYRKENVHLPFSSVLHCTQASGVCSVYMQRNSTPNVWISVRSGIRHEIS